MYERELYATSNSSQDNSSFWHLLNNFMLAVPYYSIIKTL